MTTTKTAQHTPGPWQVHKTNASRFGIRSGQDSLADVWAMIGSPVLMDRAHEGEANARLIAAAPDLLAALQLIAAHEPVWGISPQLDVLINTWIADARAAIARAIGAA